MYKYIKKSILMLCITHLFLIIFCGDVSASTDCSISLATSGNISLSIMPGNSGLTTDIITADSDCNAGYSLYISGPDDTKLYNSGESTSLDYISTVSGTKESPSVLSFDTYGYSLNSNISSEDNYFIGITNELVPLAETEQPSALGGDNYVLTYGAKVSQNKLAGSYTMSNNEGVTYYILGHEYDTVTVTFDANGGYIPVGTEWEGSGDTASKDVILGDTYGSLPEPTREGYTFLGWDESIIPDEYQEVEYVEATGTQYIKTDIYPAVNNKIVADIYVSSSTAANPPSSMGFLGVRESASLAIEHYVRLVSRNIVPAFWMDNGNGKKTIGGENPIYDTPFRYESINNPSGMYLNVNGEEFSDPFNYGDRTFRYPYFIFAYSQSGTAAEHFKGRIYRLKMFDNDVLAHDFVPVYKKSSTEIGLYDTIEGVFYPNSGSGVFEKGNDVTSYITSSSVVSDDVDHRLYAIWGNNPTVTLDANGGYIPSGEEWEGSGDTATKQLTANASYGALPSPTKEGRNFRGWYEKNRVVPEEFQEVEYLESTGEQYIITDIVPTDKTGVYARLTSYDVSNDSLFFGVTNSASIRFYVGNNSSRLYFGWNALTPSADRPPITSGINNTIQINYLNNRKLQFNDVIVNDSLTILGNAGKIAIFALYNSSTSKISYQAEMRLYEMTMTEGSDVSHLFIPVYRKSDNEAGLYDIIYHTFYTNNGTGTFSIGPSVNKPITENSSLITNSDHRIYASYETPKYNVNTTVINGTVDKPSETVYENGSAHFNFEPIYENYLARVSCTNGQKGIIDYANNELIVKDIMSDAECVVTLSDAGATILYSDGTLIIDEKPENRSNNISTHGSVVKEYLPFSNNNNYVFASATNVLWYSERTSVKRVEIGQIMNPTNTSYWFRDNNNLESGDFSNLDTSNVTSMLQMFCNSGENSTVTSFVLTGLENWDTSKVTNMDSLFEDTGHNAKTWSIGDLSNWDTSKVTSMKYMFYYAGYGASTSLTSIGTFDVSTTSVYQMFYYSRYMKATIILNSNPPSGSSGYDGMFSNASNQPGALITVNYNCDTINIDKIIGTKSSNSNVVKGDAFGACTVNVDVIDGTVDEPSKQTIAGEDVTFVITPTITGAVPAVNCTNGQTWTVSGNELTVNGLTMGTTCSVYFGDATVLYEDGALIINESTSDRADNTDTHGSAVMVY